MRITTKLCWIWRFVVYWARKRSWLHSQGHLLTASSLKVMLPSIQALGVVKKIEIAWRRVERGFQGKVLWMDLEILTLDKALAADLCKRRKPVARLSYVNCHVSECDYKLALYMPPLEDDKVRECLKLEDVGFFVGLIQLRILMFSCTKVDSYSQYRWSTENRQHSKA